MDNKKKVTFFLILGVVMFSALLIINHNKESVDELGKVNIIGTEDEYGDQLNRAYFGTTTAPEDGNPPDYVTNILFVDNKSILLENELPTYGINSLEEYLLRYYNYYLGEGIYHLSVIADTYEYDQNFPSFLVEDKDFGYTIKCTYQKDAERYKFQCNKIDGNE